MKNQSPREFNLKNGVNLVKFSGTYLAKSLFLNVHCIEQDDVSRHNNLRLGDLGWL